MESRTRSQENDGQLKEKKEATTRQQRHFDFQLFHKCSVYYKRRTGLKLKCEVKLIGDSNDGQIHVHHQVAMVIVIGDSHNEQIYVCRLVAKVI